jgi:hypothetical protein
MFPNAIPNMPLTLTYLSTQRRTQLSKHPQLKYLISLLGLMPRATPTSHGVVRLALNL